VLTNSFMAVVKNAEEEHQFLFAVNTISMVKSDALFSYIPPTNIIGWLFIPLKYLMSFKQFLRMNRLVIKLTHIPILFTIFIYERVLLSNLAYGPADMVERRGRSEHKAHLPAFSLRGPLDLFSPRLREPSVTTFFKDRALEEVFRRPYRDLSVPTPSQQYPTGRRNSGDVVADWMKKMVDDDEHEPPQDDSRSVLDRLEGRRRPYLRRTKAAGQSKRKHTLASGTVMSDPDDKFASSFARPIAEEDETDMGMEDVPQQTDADGDDEDEHASSDHEMTPTSGHPAAKENKRPQTGYHSSDETDEGLIRTPLTALSKARVSPPPFFASPSQSSFHEIAQVPPSKKTVRTKPGHVRNMSTGTVLFSPTKENKGPSRPMSPEKRPKTSTRSGTATGTTTPRFEGAAVSGSRTPKRIPGFPDAASRPRPILLPRDSSHQIPNMARFLAMNERGRKPSFNAVALDLASDLGDNNHNPNFGNADVVALPASLTTQFEMAARMKKAREQQQMGSDADSDSNRMSRIMLARMTTLEEGFRDMLQEVKGLKAGESQIGSRGTATPPNELTKRKGKAKKKPSKKSSEEERLGSSL